MDVLQYPLLETGGKPFVYASCSSLSARKGSMHGSFTFFPGRYKNSVLNSIHTYSHSVDAYMIKGNVNRKWYHSFSIFWNFVFSLARPEGPMFLATVAEFPLEFPDFIF
jgi:hypothetical protein